jgi:hypothetical protein
MNQSESVDVYLNVPLENLQVIAVKAGAGAQAP